MFLKRQNAAKCVKSVHTNKNVNSCVLLTNKNEGRNLINAIFMGVFFRQVAVEIVKISPTERYIIINKTLSTMYTHPSYPLYPGRK